MQAMIRAAVTGMTKMPIENIATRLNAANKPANVHATANAPRRGRKNNATATTMVATSGTRRAKTTPLPFTPTSVSVPSVSAPDDEMLDD